MAKSTTSRRSKLGSWREVRPGVWQVRVTSGHRTDGRPRAVSRTVHGTELDARAAARDMAEELGRRPEYARGVTLADIWAEYKEDKGARLAKKTIYNYKWLFETLWLPRLGNRDVTLITRQDVQEAMLSTTRSNASHARVALSSVLSWAVSTGRLDANPAGSGRFELPGDTGGEWEDESTWDDDPFAAISEKREVWDARTVMRALPLIRGLPLEPAWLEMVGAGLRVEEALAVRKMDVRRIEVGGRMVTQVAVHHARTDMDERKRTKTRRSVRIVAVMEPFGTRLWEVAQSVESRSDLLCPVSASNQNKRWRSYFEEPRDHPRMAESRKVSGRLRGLPYIPLARMRATHSTLMQEAGVLDSVNAATHGHSTEVAYANYQRADTTAAAQQTERYLRLVV